MSIRAHGALQQVVSARGLLVEVVFLNIITVEEVIRQPRV